MGQKFTLTIRVETTRTRGKFATRDEIAQAMCDELEGCDPGALYGLGADGDSDYEITAWDVDGEL